MGKNSDLKEALEIFGFCQVHSLKKWTLGISHFCDSVLEIGKQTVSNTAQRPERFPTKQLQLSPSESELIEFISNFVFPVLSK